MFKRKQNEIDRLNARCIELAGMLKKKNDELTIAKNNNYLIMQENADLRYENDDLRDVLKQINRLMTCNTYNNETVLKNKILELTSDYQSIS